MLTDLRPRERRGSRARCILLTNGTDDQVAAHFTSLVEPFAFIHPERHTWMPRGFAAPAEARLGKATRLLTAQQRAALTDWWLAVPKRANTPNWDLVATAEVDGRDGLVLVEAKAHRRELSAAGFAARNLDNAGRIREAIEEANSGLNATDVHPWELGCDSHYQVANRFAWPWKLASLGVPVVLVYLGFLNATEMRDRGEVFATPGSWNEVVCDHVKGVVPAKAWERRLDVAGTPFVPLIRSLTVPLASIAA
jgi:hypothetical protein